MQAYLLVLLLLLQKLLLLQPVLLILNLSPVLRNWLVAARLLDTARKRRPSGIELVSLAALGLLHGAVRHGHVAAEALAHVDQAALALAEALLELLALGGEAVDEGFAEAVGGAVALDHYAFGFLEALGERIACGRSMLIMWNWGGWAE